MKANAIRIHETGGPEVMRWEEIEVPPAGPGGEMLYRLNEIGMNGPPSFMLLSSTMCWQYD